MIAESTIEKDCPDKKRPINNCCVSHDSCYDDQKGRKYCDDIFCESSAGSEECSKVDTKMFCDLVREFGQSFYNASNATFGNKECSTDGKLFCELVKLFGEPAYKAAGKQKTTTTTSMANDNEGKF
uniref:Phospholipase A2 domain-containing protein n=1 Tax=Meloidogyne javanica TaxID=6303 RepID=A0A915LXS2_MELJA